MLHANRLAHEAREDVARTVTLLRRVADHTRDILAHSHDVIAAHRAFAAGMTETLIEKAEQRVNADSPRRIG